MTYSTAAHCFQLVKLAKISRDKGEVWFGYRVLKAYLWDGASWHGIRILNVAHLIEAMCLYMFLPLRCLYVCTYL